MLQAVDVPKVLDEIIASHSASQKGRGEMKPDQVPVLSPAFWRGRMGCSKEAQLSLVQDLSSRHSH